MSNNTKKFNPIMDKIVNRITQMAPAQLTGPKSTVADAMPSCLDIEDLVKLGK